MSFSVYYSEKLNYNMKSINLVHYNIDIWIIELYGYCYIPRDLGYPDTHGIVYAGLDEQELR